MSRLRSISVLLLAALFACVQPLAIAQEAAEHLCCIPQQKASAQAEHCHGMDAMQAPASTAQLTAPKTHHSCCDQFAGASVAAQSAGSLLHAPALATPAFASASELREFSRAIALIGRGPPVRS
jgi:hypothetical protein